MLVIGGLSTFLDFLASILEVRSSYYSEARRIQPTENRSQKLLKPGVHLPRDLQVIPLWVPRSLHDHHSETRCRNLRNSLWRPPETRCANPEKLLRVVIVGLKEKNYENLLEESREFHIFRTFMEGCAGRSRTGHSVVEGVRSCLYHTRPLFFVQFLLDRGSITLSADVSPFVHLFIHTQILHIFHRDTGYYKLPTRMLHTSYQDAAHFVPRYCTFSTGIPHISHRPTAYLSPRYYTLPIRALSTPRIFDSSFLPNHFYNWHDFFFQAVVVIKMSVPEKNMLHAGLLME